MVEVSFSDYSETLEGIGIITDASLTHKGLLI